jgi:RNA polymerase sigma factor (sigma-70 family)
MVIGRNHRSSSSRGSFRLPNSRLKKRPTEGFCPILTVGGSLLLRLTMTTSQQLLAEYLAHGSEAAFQELVMRYTNLVYSTALRLVEGDSHQAEDLAQTVFVDLARLARKLSSETMIGGWLYRHTCFVAAKAMRGERRRQARERQAGLMNTQEDHAEDNFAQVAPVLDEAINQLAPEDQSAIVLRFFEQLDFPSVGEALGSTEQAARKRVSRALDKLRDLLTARGVTLSATALGAALAARAVEAAPAEVVASLANAAVASAAAGHGTSLTFLKGLTTAKIGLSVAGIAVVTWLAWSLWGPWLPAKPPPMALNGTWTLLSTPQPLGHVIWPWALAIDADGAFYVTDGAQGGRIQKRDLNGDWSLVASASQFPGGLNSAVQSMDIDSSGDLYVAEYDRIRKRDNQGNWSTLATQGKELGQVNNWPRGFALDREGNLYVADGGGEEARVQLRRPDGQWTRLAGPGKEVGQVMRPMGLALDGKGNLYVIDYEAKRLQKRDATGRWSAVDEDPVPGRTPGSPPAPNVRFTGLL